MVCGSNTAFEMHSPWRMPIREILTEKDNADDLSECDDLRIDAPNEPHLASRQAKRRVRRDPWQTWQSPSLRCGSSIAAVIKGVSNAWPYHHRIGPCGFK